MVCSTIPESKWIDYLFWFIELTGDAIWSYAVAAATLLVALVSPSLGVIADRRAIKMWWLKILTYVGAGATLLLAFAPFLPVNTQWLWLMVMFIIANVGLNGAGVFYNALLPHMGTDDEMDDISNRAFAYGYFGGGILLVIHMALLVATDYAEWATQFSMITAAMWWYGFALLTFKWVPEPPIENEMESLGIIESTKFSLSEIKKTLSETGKFRTLFIYMLAYFFFIDGINTVTALGGVFGTVVLGLTMIDLIITILAIQFVAAPAALLFTKIAEKKGTKNALTLSLVCWVILCIGALSFAPLELENHDEHDILFEWNQDENLYNVSISENAHDLTQKLDYGDDEFDEQAWARDWAHILPATQNDDLGTIEWMESNESVSLGNSTDEEIILFLNSVNETRFSTSVSGGTLGSNTSVGVDHPTNLGDGSLDFIPETVRTYVWQPLGMTVFLQFLLLGCGMGALLGGSQGLARSLFGQMVPETRSAEFFGFFGFFGKVAAFIGPLLYGTMTVIFDSRVGLLSVGALIFAGTLMMRFVDVEKGKEAAQAEDARNRASATMVAEEWGATSEE